MVCIPECKQQLRNMKYYKQFRDIAHFKSGLYFITIREPCNNNDIDVILHGFMLQIIYTMVFRVKRLNNLMLDKNITCRPY